ncbi:MAG TPA: hypothetical protein VN455_08630 [Methanotrichaceae archaeon]|nr:hypothetical protein [Methanotrichaceae archaeon]
MKLTWSTNFDPARLMFPGTSDEVILIRPGMMLLACLSLGSLSSLKSRSPMTQTWSYSAGFPSLILASISLA